MLTGLFGFLLAGICAVWVLLNEGPVSLNGNIKNALLIVCYLFLAIRYFHQKAYILRPRLVLGIRYAMIAIFISFGWSLDFLQSR